MLLHFAFSHLQNKTMKYYLFIAGLLFPYAVFSQTILGKVANKNNEPLIGASIYWVNTTIGTTAGIKGEFELTTKGVSPKQLVASYVGHIPDTIVVNDQTFIVFKLKESQTLNEVVVKAQRNGVVISDLEPIKTEQITQTELGKAACCDLAGCFETQTTVQPQTTNVITNSKELRILGLSGVYNQILIDGFPMI